MKALSLWNKHVVQSVTIWTKSIRHIKIQLFVNKQRPDNCIGATPGVFYNHYHGEESRLFIDILRIFFAEGIVSSTVHKPLIASNCVSGAGVIELHFVRTSQRPQRCVIKI